MNPLNVLILFVALLLLWYAFTGTTPVATIRGVLGGTNSKAATSGP